MHSVFESSLDFMATSDAQTAKDILSIDMPLALLVADSGQGFVIVPDVTGIGDNGLLGAAMRPFIQILSRMEAHSLSDDDKTEMIDALNEHFGLSEDEGESQRNGVAALKSAVSTALAGGASVTALLEAFTEAATSRA